MEQKTTITLNQDYSYWFTRVNIVIQSTLQQL